MFWILERSPPVSLECKTEIKMKVFQLSYAQNVSQHSFIIWEILSSKTSHGSLVHMEQKAISVVWKHSKPAKSWKRRLFLKNPNETHELKAKSTKRFIKKYSSLWFYRSQQLQSCYSGPTILIFWIDLFW